MRGGYVYCVRFGDTQLRKVGLTTGDPVKRMKDLQTGSPERLHLECSWPTRAHPLPIEQTMHDLLANARHRGEWFTTSLEDVVRAWETASGGGAGLFWRLSLVRLRAKIRWWWEWWKLFCALLVPTALVLIQVGRLTS